MYIKSLTFSRCHHTWSIIQGFLKLFLNYNLYFFQKLYLNLNFNNNIYIFQKNIFIFVFIFKNFAELIDFTFKNKIFQENSQFIFEKNH